MTDHYSPPKFGMTAEDLANDVQDFLSGMNLHEVNPELVKNCLARIRGTGYDQYGNEDKFQNFETLPLHELFDYATEELEDFVNYMDMLVIRVFRHVEGLEIQLSEESKANWRNSVSALHQLAKIAGTMHHDLNIVKRTSERQREEDYQQAIPDSMRPSEDDAVEPEPKGGKDDQSA